MNVGAQLVAANGYANLQQGTVYYLLRSRPGGVSLIEFREMIGRNKKSCGVDGKYQAVARTYIPVLVRVPRFIFEEGISTGAIKLLDTQDSLPPWLVGAERPTSSIASVDLEKRMSWVEKANRRNEIVHPLVQKADEILERIDPDRFLNEYARACTPRQKESRVRLWFYAKVIFGTIEALVCPTMNIGRWDREQLGQKRGRKGAGGYNAYAPMARKICDGYEEFNELGKTLMQVYLDVLRVTFGCRSRAGKTPGRREVYQPDGLPFPTYSQFYYHVNKYVGESQRLEDQLGARTRREKLSYSKGPYFESVANLMSQVQSDAFFSADRPRSFLGEEPLPHLCTAKQIDVASGVVCGVGFSFGSETGEAYRLTKFCAAISKVKFCSLFGIEISPDEWPTIGLAAADLMDRGPGSAAAANAREAEPETIRTLAPSRQPRSKAAVESSHPKPPKHGEGPSFAKSDSTPIEMAKREIRRVIAHNKSANVVHHMTPDLLRDVPITVPNALWAALDQRGRNDAIMVSFDQAVRMFLPKIDAFIRDDGVYVKEQRYDSAELRKRVLGGVRRDRCQVPVEVYHLPVAMRFVWLDMDGQLVELELCFPLRAGNSQKYISFADLERYGELYRDNDASVRNNRIAAKLEMDAGVSRDTGRILNHAVVVAGRVKSGSERSKQAAADARRQINRRS